MIRDTLEKVKVLIQYVETKGQHTDVRLQPLDWRSLANHVETLKDLNAKCW